MSHHLPYIKTARCFDAGENVEKIQQFRSFVFQGPQSTKRLDRKESYKAQRRSYAKEKKRVERELLSTFKDQSIIVLADWLKIRGSLKSWTKLWCVLKPGLLLLYKSPKTKVESASNPETSHGYSIFKTILWCLLFSGNRVPMTRPTNMHESPLY